MDEKIPDKLYHYTTANCFCKIIDDNKFKYSDFSKLNDLREKNVDIKTSFEDNVYGFISLSMVSTNPVMWNFYAEKYQGVCFEFDISKMIKNNIISVDDIKKVKYVENRALSSELNSNNMIEYLSEKSKEWEHEQEYRIFSTNGHTAIENITDYISGVIFGRSKAQSYKNKDTESFINSMVDKIFAVHLKDGCIKTNVPYSGFRTYLYT